METAGYFDWQAAYGHMHDRFPATRERPVVGITGNFGDKGCELAEGYYASVLAAGAVPVVIPPFEDRDALAATLETVDGLLLSGGGDLNPLFLGEEPVPELHGINARRDLAELLLTRLAYDRQIPILGICRGIQILNVYLGGTLWYDLPTRYEPTWPAWAQEALASEDAADKAASCGTPQGDDGPQEKHAASGSAGSHAAEPCALLAHNLHKPNGDYDGDSYAHDVRFAAVSRLAAVFGCRRMPVNSLHHQALGIVAPDLVVTAVSPDGVIEAVEHRDRPNVMAVQWHPEYFACADEKDDGRMGRFFSALVADAQAFKTARQRTGIRRDAERRPGA